MYFIDKYCIIILRKGFHIVNTEIIKQIQQQIDYLELEKQKIEVELEAAKNYLNVLKGNYSGCSIKNEPKGNQSLEAREKMRKAQQERQERERKLRLNAIRDFLLERETATTQEIANYLNLKENATKRYLRGCNDFEEVRINVWKYGEIPF